MLKERMVEQIRRELADGTYGAADPDSLAIGEIERSRIIEMPFSITYKAELQGEQSKAFYRQTQGGGGPWGPESSVVRPKRFLGYFDDNCELVDHSMWLRDSQSLA